MNKLGPRPQPQSSLLIYQMLFGIPSWSTQSAQEDMLDKTARAEVMVPEPYHL